MYIWDYMHSLKWQFTSHSLCIFVKAERHVYLFYHLQSQTVWNSLFSKSNKRCKEKYQQGLVLTGRNNVGTFLTLMPMPTHFFFTPSVYFSFEFLNLSSCPDIYSYTKKYSCPNSTFPALFQSQISFSSVSSFSHFFLQCTSEFVLYYCINKLLVSVSLAFCFSVLT